MSDERTLWHILFLRKEAHCQPTPAWDPSLACFWQWPLTRLPISECVQPPAALPDRPRLEPRDLGGGGQFAVPRIQFIP